MCITTTRVLCLLLPLCHLFANADAGADAPGVDHVLAAIENRQDLLGFPSGFESYRTEHLLHRKWINRCDFHRVECSSIPKKGAGRKAAMDAIRAVLQPKATGGPDDDDGPRSNPRPILLHDCDSAMGFDPLHDLTRSALTGGSSSDLEDVRINVTAQDARQAFTNPNPSIMTVSRAVDSPYYFDAKSGRVAEYMLPSNRRRKKMYNRSGKKIKNKNKRRRRKRPGSPASWLPHALDKTFGTFAHHVDSFQQDASVVAHEHTTGWLYLVSGLKMWVVSPHHRPPPPRVQWSLPLESWCASDEEALRTVEEQWFGAEVCMQQPGDVVILPHYAWHATVSIGHSVGIGKQHPRKTQRGAPVLIKRLRGAKGINATLDALWQLHAQDRHSLKYILLMGEAIEEYKIATRAKKDEGSKGSTNMIGMTDLADQVSRVIKAARDTIATAKGLQRRDLIRRHNVAMVQEAMKVVIDTLAIQAGQEEREETGRNGEEKGGAETAESSKIKIQDVETLRKELDFPLGFSPKVRHLLHPDVVGRCDFQTLSCADVEKGGGQAMRAIRDALWHPTRPELSTPVLLTQCEEALLGLANVSTLLNRKALRRLAGHRTSVKLAAQHASQSYTVPSQKISLLKKVFDKRNDMSDDEQKSEHTAAASAFDYYFDPHGGKISHKLFRGKNKQREGRASGWLVTAFDATFGRFDDDVDSVQRDASVVAHEHVTGWLYLASGLKLWAVSNFEAPPPALVQWALPLDSWASPASRLFPSRDGLQERKKHNKSQTKIEWRPELCMQTPGSIVLLPHFAWHATVSLGHTLAFGMQRPRKTNQGMPRLIERMRRAGARSDRGDDRAVLDTLWKMQEADPSNVKIIRRIGVLLQDVTPGHPEVMPDVEKMRRVARDTIERAERMHEAEVEGLPRLREKDLDTVRDAMEDVLGALSYHPAGFNSDSNSNDNKKHNNNNKKKKNVDL